MEALIDAFHLDWKLIVAQLINFAIVFFVLYKFALKPLAKLMAERKETIQKGLENAEVHAKLVKETQAVYDKELANAREEAHKLSLSMKAEVETRRMQLLTEAQHEAEKIVEETHKHLKEQKDHLLEEARKEIGMLVVSTTEKVIAEAMTPDMKARLAEHAAKEMKL